MKAHLLDTITESLAARRPVGLAFPFENGPARIVFGDDPLLGPDLREALRRDRPRLVDTPDGPVWLRPYAPRLRLLVIGAVHITAALVSMARTADYDVVLIDPRRGFARAERWPGVEVHDDYPDDVMETLGLDPRTAVVALTHDPKIDDPGLEAALASDCFYIGALGSKKTHARRLDRLRERGHSDARLARIHGPIGLNIGAATPAEIAVAILAEVTGALRARPEGA